jgi:hypothetical protein
MNVRFIRSSNINGDKAKTIHQRCSKRGSRKEQVKKQYSGSLHATDVDCELRFKDFLKKEDS